MKAVFLLKIPLQFSIVKISILILILSLPLLTGCANMFIQQYGHVTSDDEIIRMDGKAVYIPENAPSISQGYKPGSFGKTDLDNTGNHEGIDIISKRGTPVIAVASGVVVSSFYRPLFGNRILIDHGKDENGMFIMSRYVHLDKRLMKKGDKVVRGQQIGTLGSTGLLAGGFPHLHFEIRLGLIPEISKSEPHNPHRFWSDGIGIVTCFDAMKPLSDRPIRTTYPVPCKL
jgi:murein DD-endopeptidase MepM/ murein hydrolase activator NlpD